MSSARRSSLLTAVVVSALTLVAAFARVEDWTSNGLHVPQQVGARTTNNCAQIIQLNGGKWTPVSGNGFQCGPLIDVGG